MRSFHVGANRTTIDQYITHPFRFQFRADTGQRWWDSALVTQVEVDRLKVRIAFGRHAAKIASVVTSDAVK